MRILEGNQYEIIINCQLKKSFCQFLFVLGLKSAVALEKSSPQVVLQQQQQQQRQQSQQQQQLCQQPRSYEKSVPSTERSDGGPEMEKRGGYHRHGAAISLPHGIALFDYDSNENGTLKFKRGDIIHLKRQLDKLWYIGESQQIEGVFPINLIHVNYSNIFSSQSNCHLLTRDLFRSHLD